MACTSGFLRHRRPETTPGFSPFDRAGRGCGRWLIFYGRVLPFLLAGYLLFDKAFAYIHIPGMPLYVGELVLTIGAVGVGAAIRYLLAPLEDEPVLALLSAFFFFGVIRLLPGLPAYGVKAVRDFALVYYCLYAFLTVAVLARSPDLLERLVVQLLRFVPWLLLWLPLALILYARSGQSFAAPFSAISIFDHKPGDAAIAAAVALGCLWLFPGWRSARSRMAWSTLALGDLVLAGTQNRGGLLGAIAAAMIGLVFISDRWRLVMRSIVILVLGLTTATVLPVRISTNNRAFSAPQLIANVASIAGAQENPELSGTVNAREELWSRILNHQMTYGTLIFGSGFGIDLAAQPGTVADDASAQPTTAGVPDELRNPHNSDLDILARTGLAGLFLWLLLWVGWYWRLISGCRRLMRRGLYARKQIAVLCLMVATATLVSSFFDPQLEGPQGAILLWVTFGVGAVVTSSRWWFGARDLHLDHNNYLATRLSVPYKPCQAQAAITLAKSEERDPVYGTEGADEAGQQRRSISRG